MSEIIIYNQQMFVSEKELARGPVHGPDTAWVKLRPTSSGTPGLTASGRSTTERNSLMAADAAKAPVENGLKNKRDRKGLVKRMNAREILPWMLSGRLCLLKRNRMDS